MTQRSVPRPSNLLVPGRCSTTPTDPGPVPPSGVYSLRNPAPCRTHRTCGSARTLRGAFTSGHTCAYSSGTRGPGLRPVHLLEDFFIGIVGFPPGKASPANNLRRLLQPGGIGIRIMGVAGGTYPIRRVFAARRLQGVGPGELGLNLLIAYAQPTARSMKRSSPVTLYNHWMDCTRLSSNTLPASAAPPESPGRAGL